MDRIADQAERVFELSTYSFEGVSINGQLCAEDDQWRAVLRAQDGLLPPVSSANFGCRSGSKEFSDGFFHRRRNAARKTRHEVGDDTSVATSRSII